MNKEMAICPYYKGSTRYRIKCQGLYEGTEITTQFETEANKRTHSKMLCETFNYKLCIYAKKLEEKYEDTGKTAKERKRKC